MGIHQIHFERKFYLDKKKGYWISTDYPRIRAHRWVWIKTHGIIPKGYHIHHKNEDKSDNRIENLELIERSRHLSHHYTEEDRERSRKLVERIRPMTKAWHSSIQGKTWHKYHAFKSKFGNWEPSKYICQFCNKEYESKKKSNAIFCTNACKSAWRRESGLDDIQIKCQHCGIEFVKNRYAKTRFCSRICSAKHQHKTSSCNN